MELPIKWLSYEDLAREAKRFLDRYHPSGSIPVPIEEIIELQLEIDIIPVPGLRDCTDCDAYTTSDVEKIIVDEFVYKRRANRYRFSLAHEVAHPVLHSKVYPRLGYHDLRSFKEGRNRISDNDQERLEWQANCFAGLILVPSSALVNTFDAAISLAQTKGVAIQGTSQEAKDMINKYIAQEFQVSADVISIRIEKTGLWKSLEKVSYTRSKV